MIIIAVSIIKPAPDVPLSHFSTKGNSKLSKVIAHSTAPAHKQKKFVRHFAEEKKILWHCTLLFREWNKNSNWCIVFAISVVGGFPICLRFYSRAFDRRRRLYNRKIFSSICTKSRIVYIIMKYKNEMSQINNASSKMRQNVGFFSLIFPTA